MFKNKGYLYFNGCLNYPNFQQTFSTNASYTLEFWIKLDRLNEFCKIPDNFKKYYFIADPHVIYSEPLSLSSVNSSTNPTFNKNTGYAIYYQMISRPAIKVQLKNFSQFNWNHVLIHSNYQKKVFRVITNFNFYNPDYALDNFDNVFEINSQNQKIIFCSKDSFCSALGNRLYLTNVAWGAAYYKDLRLSEGTNWNFFIAQEYISGS